MPYKERTVGGGPAKQLGNDWTQMLSQFINTGSFGGGSASQQFSGADPGGSAANVFSLINSLISNPQADQGVQDLIGRDIQRGRDNLREGFGGGTGMGTPAAFAQALFESEQAPRAAIAQDEMARNRLASIMPFFQAAGQTAQLGIPQAQTTLEPPAWLQGVNLGLDVAGAVAPFFGGPPGLKTQGTEPSLIPTRPGSFDLPQGNVAARSPGGFNTGGFAMNNPRFAQQLYL